MLLKFCLSKGHWIDHPRMECLLKVHLMHCNSGKLSYHVINFTVQHTLYLSVGRWMTVVLYLQPKTAARKQVEFDKACFVIRDVVVQYIFGSSALYSLKSRNVLYKVGCHSGEQYRS